MSRFVIVASLMVVNVVVFTLPVSGHLTVSFLDVGQGDAIFIEGPTGVQVLVDGGPNTAVLRGLGRRMSFFDRSLDAVVATHPDADHIGGLSDVFERYDVGAFFEPGVLHDTGAVSALEAALEKEKIQRTLARRGMRLLLGGGTSTSLDEARDKPLGASAYIDILFPDRDVSGVSDTNAGSIMLRVVYGKSEFMLTGDAPQHIERSLTTIYGSALESDVLKAGHHGSKTSSDEAFVRSVSPRYVVYSRGCDNRYGHPAPETALLFQKLAIPALDTCERGTITFRSNGKTLSIRYK